MTQALATRLSLSIVPCLALGLSACVEPPDLGADEGALVTDERALYDLIDPSLMRDLYYGINPPRHAEKAYQVGDPAPPLSARATEVDASGTITVLATTIYNRPPFGRARFTICDESGAALTTRVLPTPARLEVHGLVPGSEVYIRPETLGTMVKLLTPEQIAAAGF